MDSSSIQDDKNCGDSLEVDKSDTIDCLICLESCQLSVMRKHVDCDFIACDYCLEAAIKHCPRGDFCDVNTDLQCGGCRKFVNRKDFIQYKKDVDTESTTATIRMDDEEQQQQPVESAMMSISIEEKEDDSIGSMTTEEHLEEEFLDAEEGDDNESMDDTLVQDSDGVIIITMNLQERLLELNEIFDSFATNGMSLHNFWAMYLETYVEPVGWIALLKPKQDLHHLSCSGVACHENEVVEVLQVNCSTLESRVKREGDDDPFDVPLFELYPLAKQENEFLAMKITAQCIDNYRFFVNHLFWPFDQDDAKNWCEKHLESRIQLYHDLHSGAAISESMSKEIISLIEEAKRNQQVIDKLEDQLEYSDCDGDIDENVVLQLLPIHTRQDEINLRLTKLENPLWRNILGIMKQAKKRNAGLISEKVILIAENFTCSELTSDLQFICRQVGDNEKICIVRTLQEALDTCQPGVKIFVKPGVHPISGLGNLEEAGSIIGMPGPENNYDSITIETKDAGDVWLVTNTESSVSIENVKIRVCPLYTPPLTSDDNGSLLPDKQPACYLSILVQTGSLKMKNVTLEGFSETGIGFDEIETNGIKVIGSGSMSLTNCKVVRFATGIVVREQAQVNLIESEVESCVVGIETSSEAKLQLSHLKVMKCLKFGLKVYSNVDTTTVGSAEILETLHNFTTNEISFQDCVAGGVCICRYVRLSSGNPGPVLDKQDPSL